MSGSVARQHGRQDATKAIVRGKPRAARRSIISLAALALALGATTPSALASVAEDELDLDIEGVVLMSQAELEGSRGGFTLGPFLINLGIQITTTVNNAVSVQTVLSFDPTTLAANITAGVTAATATAGAGAAAAGAAAMTNVATNTTIAVTIPQVVIGSVAGDETNTGQQQVQQNSTGGNSDSIPIPVAAGVITEIQDAVAQSGIGDYLPSQTEPDVQAGQPVETPEQLAQLILDGAPSVAEAQAFAAEQVPALDDVAAVGTGAANTVPAVTITELVNGAIYDVDGTIIAHQIMNGVLASIQNANNDVSISQTVQMTVDIANFATTLGTGIANMQVASLGQEIAKFSSTIGN